METTLHQQLKEHYCGANCETEVQMGRFRIDVVSGDRLIEIQHSSLSAIRAKIQALIVNHKVDVVKPIIVKKRLIKLSKKNGRVLEKRQSPKRGNFLDLIDELLYFTRVFPNHNLRIITPLVAIDEKRYPGHGKRRRRRTNDFVVQDRLMTKLFETETYQTAADLLKPLPVFSQPFCTQQLADKMKIKRWQAQRIAYVLKHAGSFQAVDKRGNSILYVQKREKRDGCTTAKTDVAA